MPPETTTIAVPSMKGIASSFKDFGIGALGGAVYGISRLVLGNGLLGALGAPILAGSAIPGPRGVALATVAGYMALAGLFSGNDNGARAAGNEEVT